MQIINIWGHQIIGRHINRKMHKDRNGMYTEPAIDAPRMRGKNRLRTLDDLDGRTNAAKRANSLVAGLESDMGGARQITVGQRELIKRAALLGAYIEDCEVRWLRNETVEMQEYLAAINAQRRVLATLGLERRATDVTSLGKILRAGNGQRT